MSMKKESRNMFEFPTPEKSKFKKGSLEMRRFS